MSDSTLRVGTAGAGLLGRLLAVRLTQAGHEVHVYDPAAGAPARGATGWTAAGMLSPLAELETADERVFAWGLRSIELWPGILRGLPQPVEFSCDGSLLVAHREDAGAARRVLDLLARKAPPGHQAEPLTAAALRELEPSLRAGPQAWLLPGEGRIHTVQAMLALAAGAPGAHWHWGACVQEVEPGRLGVDGRTESFDRVFDVRGLGARPQLPVRGVRGEIFWLQAPGPGLRPAGRLVPPPTPRGLRPIPWSSARARSKARTARRCRCARRSNCWPRRTASCRRWPRRASSIPKPTCGRPCPTTSPCWEAGRA